MLLEVSIGEALDKLCILELKLKKIKINSRLIEVQKEYDYLLEHCSHLKIKYSFLYSLLMYVNEYIWDIQDNVKLLPVDHPDFAKISDQIFKFNDKRFRIKNIINSSENSNLKEQKGYSLKHIHLKISDNLDLKDIIPNIYYLTLEYDSISFDTSISTLENLKSIFTYSNFIYTLDTTTLTSVELDTIVFPTDLSIFKN